MCTYFIRKVYRIDKNDSNLLSIYSEDNIRLLKFLRRKNNITMNKSPRMKNNVIINSSPIITTLTQ